MLVGCTDFDKKCDVENWIVTTVQLDDAFC